MAKKVKLEWPLGKERRISLSMRSDEPIPLHLNSWMYLPAFTGSAQVEPSSISGWHTCGRKEMINMTWTWAAFRQQSFVWGFLLLCHMCRKLESRQQLHLHLPGCRTSLNNRAALCDGLGSPSRWSEDPCGHPYAISHLPKWSAR